MKRALAASISLLVLSGLTACGSDDSNDSDAAQEPTSQNVEEETTAADGELITGSAYTYNVPQGWGEPEAMPGFDPDSMARNLEDEDGFADNINVIAAPGGEITPEQVEEAGAQQLESSGAKDVEVSDRVEIAGVESARLTGGMSMNNVDYTVEQVYATNAGQTYVVTFSFGADVSDDERDAVVDSVLASWTWTD